MLRVVIYPDDGIVDLYPNGVIGSIDPAGPAAGNLQEGDIILSIDGVRWGNTITSYYGKRGGDQVNYLVERSGKEILVSVTLADPPIPEILMRLVPILVALIFMGIGTGVKTFKPSDVAANIFFAWCLVSATTLASGVTSYLGPPWTSGLFNSCLWLLGPISIHLHLYFPQPALFRYRRGFLASLYLFALLGILPNLVLGGLGIRPATWSPQFILVGRGFLAINLLIVVGLLIYTYQHATAPGARGKIRIVALGGGLTAILLVTLTIIPDTLFQQPLIPYRFAFLLLSVLPLTYGYAIFRLHMIEIERHVNRGATFILVYSILGGFYLILYAFLVRFLPPRWYETRLVNTILVLFLAGVFVPLHRRIVIFVDRAFYGGWYDYRLAVTQILQGLEQITDLKLLGMTVSERLVQTLRLEEASMFLRDAIGDFSVIEVALWPEHNIHPSSAYPILPHSSLTYLLTMGVIERANLRKALSEVSLSQEELQLLNSEQIHLWVPLIDQGQIVGLLALGPKIGGDVFSAEDFDILRVVAGQLGPVIENIHLVTQLKGYAAELEQRVRERTAELMDAKERVEAILASVGDGVIVTDLDGQILTVNAALEKQSGYSATEIINKNVQTLLEEPINQNKLDNIWTTLRQGEVWSGELTGQQKNGEVYDIYLTFAPVCDHSGKIVSYVGSQRDITRQKELDRLKDAFVADVSHELRTPTTNIKLYLDLLDDAPPEKYSKYLAVIREQSYQLAKLVEDILDLSRLARAKYKKADFSEVDLNQLVEQVITAHIPLAVASGLKLIFEPERVLPPVLGEQSQISRMITNLISNAIRYTHQGEVHVTTCKAHGQAVLTVADTGMGIDAEDLPHIFDRFYRGRNVRQSDIPGTGLGLAIVKEIVDLHEGELEVQSESGKGSTFRVNLPICR